MKSNLKNCFAYLFLLSVMIGCNSNPGNSKQEKIAYVMEQAYKNQEFVGNVLVADSGEIVYQKSFGKSDAERNVENTNSTRFLIASISKPITAIIMLRLVDQGLVKLNDPVSAFFKIKNSAVGKITIHQLLTHSSGINEFISKEKDLDLNKSLNATTLKFPPGSDFEYSNSGFVLLMKIAEHLTGKKYPEIVKNEVFTPAQMNQSGVARNNETGEFTKGYKDAAQKNVSNIDFPFENVDGAGSLYSTTGDLYRLDQALRTNGLLSENSKTLMLTPHIPEKYAYGWFVRERGGIWDWYWHKGDLPGVTTIVSRRAKKDQLIVLLANAENLPVADIENDIAKILKVTQ